MAGLQRAAQHPRLCFITCVSTVLLLVLFSQDLRDRRQDERHKRDILESTEIPAEHIDPAAIDLTPLVNTLINTSQSGSRQLFSLLSVTSYSSLALHKLTLLVYNISSIRSIESNKFRRRFCYCVTNETNDLTDFTAILLDVMGNSTSYLHELFKSASILSVSQRNNSDCIYICVMAGKMGREVSELWQVDAITPLFNQTIVEGPHRVGNVSSIRLPMEWHQVPTNLSHISPSGMSSMLTSRVHSTAHVSPTTMEETAATAAKITTAQPLATARQPTTSVLQSQTTASRQETTIGTTQPVTTQRPTTARPTTPLVTTQRPTMPRPTTPRPTTARPTTQRLATQRPTTQLVTTQRPITQRPTTQLLTTQRPTTQRPTTQAVTTATETSQPLTSTQPNTTLQLTTSTAATPSTTSPTQLTTVSTRPTTSSAVISLTWLTTATHQPRTTTQHTTSTVHPTSLSPVRPTAGPTLARRTTRPLDRKTTTLSKPTEKPEVVLGEGRS
ncbi:uncharacterized protein [Pagrus major]|uniref:uncharacterized protein isoform X2 n=1 Tax=Pagrus major TaxID=143350 RepID=UPI003CC88BD1